MPARVPKVGEASAPTLLFLGSKPRNSACGCNDILWSTQTLLKGGKADVGCDKYWHIWELIDQIAYAIACISYCASS